MVSIIWAFSNSFFFFSGGVSWIYKKQYLRSTIKWSTVKWDMPAFTFLKIIYLAKGKDITCHKIKCLGAT